MKHRSSTSKKKEEDVDRGRRISTRQDQDNSHHEGLKFQLHQDATTEDSRPVSFISGGSLFSAPINRLKNLQLDSGEEDLTEEEVNPQIKIEGEIIASSSEASLEIGKEQVNHHGDRSCNTSSPCIFRTPFPGLAFQEPQLASIGPYHRDKNLPLDKYKYSFLKKFRSRTRNQGEDLCFFYVRLMMKLERRTRRCYSEDFSMSSAEFVEMMLVDACFIMEVLRHFGRSEEFVDGDFHFPIEPWQTPILVRDLLLLENQIPFFILEELSALSKSEETTTTVSVSVITMAFKMFDLAFPRSLDFACKFNHLEEPKHLLDLFLQTIRPSNPSTNSLSLFLKTIFLKAKVCLNSLSRKQMPVADGLILKTRATGSGQKEYHLSTQSKPSTSKTTELFHLSENALELRKSGIEFKPRRADRFTDIHFKGGVLEIPPVTVNDLFIAILVNCVALEHCSNGCPKDLTVYASFMSSLIRYPTDVECLCSDGIISRFSNDDKQVASSFNSLRPNISDSDFDNIQDSYLFKTIMETNRYHKGDGITWLRHCLRDPRIFLFCITNLCFASYWLSLASLTFRLIPITVSIIGWCQGELDDIQKSMSPELTKLTGELLIDLIFKMYLSPL